ncbi:MAG: cadmium-translocating P-type ATPase [Tenericutes bacterium]|nr:cadmium-translocating P-type ATPase [Mycoplasmatota bacterium]
MKLELNEELYKIFISTILFILAIIFKINILFIFAYIIISYELFIEAIKEKELFNEATLMIIATIGAIFINEYQEAVIVMILFQLGEYLSDLAVNNSKKSIIELMDLRSDIVTLEDNTQIDIDDCKIGTKFVVKPGEKIPLDGIVIEGSSTLDTKSLTGESKPLIVKKNSEVLSGSINLDSILIIKSTKTSKTSTAARIIDIIENSNENKTKTEKFITRFSKVYTPIVCVLAILLVIIPTLLGEDFSTWLYRSLNFLVISCPCALVISIPLGFFCGIGRASHEGILIKGSNELEHLSSIKALVFDKTGTITHGNFDVDLICNKGINKEELLEIAAYAEYYSNHPIAKSILKKYNKKIDKKRISDYKEVSGKGIKVKIDNNLYLVGNEKLLKNIDIDIHNDEIGTTVYIAREQTYLGHIVITDTIKKEAYKLVDNLEKLNINKVIMLSGDNIDIVSKVGKEIKIKEYYGNLLPQDKVDKINEIKKDFTTAFVGDGINDAPVIKLSDIGIAIGGIGSDATIEASDIVLLKDDLNNIPKAIKISKLTKRIIKFNIIFAITFKIFILLLAAIGYTSIWLSVLSDVGVTILSILNSLRILYKEV